MMQFGFGNYDGFKELFVREDGKRKNGVLLSFFKNKDVRKFARDQKKLRKILNIKSMGELFAVCDAFVRETARGSFNVCIFDKYYHSSKYASDRYDGVCEDGDFTTYRYQNMERDGQIFKMKIGKMYKHLIQSSDFGKLLNEQVILFMCEEMARKWMAENSAKYPKYHLHVDDNFEKIYSSKYLAGGFGSCMTDECRHDFYCNAVNAKAAYLTNDDGMIVARCVIFNECKDENGKVWRLAERQYSSDGNEVLKSMLVYSLIKEGYIDGYKKVGADCHNSRAFMDVNDQPIANPNFSIRCNLDLDDILSYQDSFKWYDYGNSVAYNWDAPCDDLYMLDTTDETLDGTERYYDEYHDRYTRNDIVGVYVNGRYMDCDEEELGDFIWVEQLSEYHHVDDVSTCDRCDDNFVVDRGGACYSDITEEYYCCEDCMEAAEAEYRINNWSYSEYDDEYVEDIEEFYNIENGEHVKRTISEESLDYLKSTSKVVEIDGEWYLKNE